MAAIAVPAIEAGEFKHNDGLKSGGRSPVLWLVRKSGEVLTFTGSTIPGIVEVISAKFEKNGKWSNTTYRIKVGSAIPVDLLAPLHGKTWNEETWEAAWRAISALVPHVSRPSWEEAMRRDFTRTAERFDSALALPALE